MNIPDDLINPFYNDRYFDVVNALEEAKYIFFNGCDLLSKCQDAMSDSKCLIIGETGFGAGRNLISLMDYLENSAVCDLSLTYNSVELHPLTVAKMKMILARFEPVAEELIYLLLDSYRKLDINNRGWHHLKFDRPSGSIFVNLWIGEALEMVNALPYLCDAWFLDGHGPKKNPAMWRPELLAEIGKKTKPRGTCATFTVAGDVRKALTDAGFTVERVPGIGGKKLVLKGLKNI